MRLIGSYALQEIGSIFLYAHLNVHTVVSTFIWAIIEIISQNSVQNFANLLEIVIGGVPNISCQFDIVQRVIDLFIIHKHLHGYVCTVGIKIGAVKMDLRAAGQQGGGIVTLCIIAPLVGQTGLTVVGDRVGGIVIVRQRSQNAGVLIRDNGEGNDQFGPRVVPVLFGNSVVLVIKACDSKLAVICFYGYGISNIYRRTPRVTTIRILAGNRNLLDSDLPIIHHICREVKIFRQRIRQNSCRIGVCCQRVAGDGVGDDLKHTCKARCGVGGKVILEVRRHALTELGIGSGVRIVGGNAVHILVFIGVVVRIGTFKDTDGVNDDIIFFQCFGRLNCIIGDLALKVAS